jgi:hypothetical protein
MHVIRHIVYGDQFLILTGNNASKVFLKSVVVVVVNQTLSAANRKNDVDVKWV